MTCYRDWIEWRLAQPGTPPGGYGRCAEISREMAEAFPELAVRKGVFRSAAWGDRTHWWCLAPDGQIVDPTATQHPDGRWFPLDAGAYVDLTDVSEEEAVRRALVPRGKCLECGDPVYWPAEPPFCRRECEDAYVAAEGAP